jgi:GTP-binding protein YchF
MTLRCGIVGLPNVGKSTIFNALTASRVAAENYPFCTIEPNTGVVPVPDPRLQALAAIVQAREVVPTSVEFTDIAGLVRGASRGEGLGNQFLAHIRETHAVAHVVRCFDDENLVHAEGAPDPLRDLEIVETELGLADLDTVERRLERARKGGKAGDKATRALAGFLEALRDHLDGGRPARAFEVPDDMAVAFRDCHLLTAKPLLYVANLDEPAAATGNDYSRALEAHAGKTGDPVVRICGLVEAELAELDDAEKQPFLEDLGLEEPGLHRLIHAAYRALDLVTFLTTAERRVRAWTVKRGTLAPQAAGEIHTDFERHFIRAEVTAFDDFLAAGGEARARATAMMHVHGKDYEIREGDVIHFRAGV